MQFRLMDYKSRQSQGSGMLMLTPSIVMLINPSIMNDYSGSLANFEISILATFLVLILHRLVLPKLGI
ncbi:MAG TPA: hypothetical protein DIW44_00965 [Anaerolineaceae bacterium]|nr:hypothetical protein [Anaerolineaceae bacterium]